MADQPLSAPKPPLDDVREMIRLFPEAHDVLTRQEMRDAKGNWRSLIDQQTKALTKISAALSERTAAGEVERLREALQQIRAGSRYGIDVFEQRVRDRKDRLTWFAVNVLQDNLAACEGTASAALSTERMMNG